MKNVPRVPSSAISIIGSLIPATLLLILLTGRMVYAVEGTITVCPAGPPACDFATIGAAVDSAVAGDTISVGPGNYAEHITIALTMTISGAGPTQTVIDGTHNGRVIAVLGDVSVNLSQLAILNGVTQYQMRGGGIYNPAGTLVVNHIHFIGNTAISGGSSGGGLYNGHDAEAIISDSLFESNSSNRGGGIDNVGNLFVTDSSFIDNFAGSGAGIYNDRFAVVTITNGIFTLNNSAGGHGLDNDGAAWVEYSLFADNEGPGGSIQNSFSGNVSIIGSRFMNKSDGVSNAFDGVVVISKTAFIDSGIYNSHSGRLTLMNSSITGAETTSNFDGMIDTFMDADGFITITNSTIAQNEAPAIVERFHFEGGNVLIINSTLSGNRLGIDRSDGAVEGMVSLVNTVVAGNEDGDCVGTIISLGHNLDSDGSCMLNMPGDLPAMDPLLFGLQEGAGTFYHPLQEGSPAIDAGDNGNCPETDQRGVPRPIGSDCDIGAYEGALLLDMRGYLPLVSGP